MSDFIREVDEEYRRDRAIKFLARYQVPLAILVVLVIVGAGGWRYWVDRQTATAEAVNARFMAASDLAKAGNTQQALADFLALGKEAPKGYATLARMRIASLLADVTPETGAKAFDAIASDESLAVSLRDAARLRGAMIRVDTEEPKAFESRYGRFSVPGFTYNNSIRELLALAAMKRQDFTAAKRYLGEIIIDPRAPGDLRDRAQAFVRLVAAGPTTPMTTQPPPAAIKPAGAPKPAPAATAAPAPPPQTPH